MTALTAAPGSYRPTAAGTTDRAIRLSTAAAVLAVAASQRMSPTGTPTPSSANTARAGSPPGWSRPPSTAWSTPPAWSSCTRRGTRFRYPPGPAGCSGWASRPPSPPTWHKAGPTVPSGQWSRPGRRPALPARTSCWSGSSAPPDRRNPSHRQNAAVIPPRAAQRRLPPRPRPQAASSMVTGLENPIPPMTRRWPRTGSACRPGIRSRSASSPRCSGAPPAAGHVPGSERHGNPPRQPAVAAHGSRSAPPRQQAAARVTRAARPTSRTVTNAKACNEPSQAERRRVQLV
jgi:hypothetical protein